MHDFSQIIRKENRKIKKAIISNDNWLSLNTKIENQMINLEKLSIKRKEISNLLKNWKATTYI